MQDKQGGKKRRAGKKPIIVFTDVFEKDEESSYDLLLKAHNLNAILLKRDIARLNIKRRSSRVEFFLIADDESENIEQAIKLTQEYKDECRERAISIFVYSNKQSAAYILDSLDKGKFTVDSSLLASISSDPTAFLTQKLYSSKTIDSAFYVRRIDYVEILAQQMLISPDVLRTLFENNPSKTLSITILGMGSFGKEFLKNALWLYQLLGYKLEINVFDATATDIGLNKTTIKTLGHEWPEIIDDAKKRSFVKDEPGDCCYDIHFFDGIDCFSSDFDDLFKPESPYSARLSRARLVIVALGDDDKNIDAAVMLRSLFDRVKLLQNQTIPKEPLPRILSVVYDDRKAANLSVYQDSKKGIVNHRGQSFQIDFIGNLKSLYSYATIQRQKRHEDKALRYHLDWLRREVAKNDSLSKEDLSKLAESILANTTAYMDYEYYRKSSIARAIYEVFLQHTKQYVPKEPTPVELSISEHMRWDMYMRTQGYRYYKIRNDRAKMHDDLRIRSYLPGSEQDKDF